MSGLPVIETSLMRFYRTEGGGLIAEAKFDWERRIAGTVCAPGVQAQRKPAGAAKNSRSGST